MTIDPPTTINPGDPTVTCDNYAEAEPERSVNTPFPGSPPAVFTGYGNGAVNSATDWNAWSASNFTVPKVDPIPTWGGDFWSTTSGTTGLDYLSLLLSNGGQLCAAVAATTATHRQSNIWDFPAQCILGNGNYDNGDGPSIAYDQAGHDLWMAQSGGSSSGTLFIFKNCNAGAPGTPACPITSTIPLTGTLPHPVVAVEPCNHLGMVAFQTPSPGSQVAILFYNDSGVLVQTLYAPYQHESFDQATACNGMSGQVPKCNQPTTASCVDTGAPPQCLRLAAKVQIATQVVDGGICRAYLGFDASHLSTTDGKNYFRSNLFVLDTTPSGGATVIAGYRDAANTVTFNSYGTTVSATDTKSPQGNYAAGWYWYSEWGDNVPGGNACSTEIVGEFSVDRFETQTGQTQAVLRGGYFPSLELFGPVGMGDYQGSLKRGLPGGILYPSWVQPVQMTSGNCISCENVQYSAPIMATRVHVP